MRKEQVNSNRVWLTGLAALLGLASVGAVIEAPAPPPIGPCERGKTAVPAETNKLYDVTTCDATCGGTCYVLVGGDLSYCVASTPFCGCRTTPVWRLCVVGRCRVADLDDDRLCKCVAEPGQTPQQRWVNSAENCDPSR